MRSHSVSIRFRVVFLVLCAGMPLGLGAARPVKAGEGSPAGPVGPSAAPAPVPLAPVPAETTPVPAPDPWAWPERLGDPRSEEVPLPAAEGWSAFLVHDNRGIGVWTVKAFDVFPRLATPELVAIDDHGILRVFTLYSGKWAPLEVIRDGSWLGGLVHGDVDPRVPGREIYTGSQRGNLYQVLAHSNGVLEHRLIASFDGLSVNTLVAADLDANPGPELYVFTWPGGLYRADPTGDGGTFRAVPLLREVEGRVRDAVLLPRGAPDRPLELATVSRSGALALTTLGREGVRIDPVHRERTGMGRVALGTASVGAAVVLYTTLDDGRILRHERATPSAEWRTETIYLGHQGPRGIVAGRFFADPAVEGVAIYGYSGLVELLSRAPGAEAWSVETLYKDPGKGHWLTSCEVDGRNATDELAACGFDGRIVLLARPRGYGRTELAAPLDDE